MGMHIKQIAFICSVLLLHISSILVTEDRIVCKYGGGAVNDAQKYGTRHAQVHTYGLELVKELHLRVTVAIEFATCNYAQQLHLFHFMN